jgi:hypothetical protein
VRVRESGRAYTYHDCGHSGNRRANRGPCRESLLRTLHGGHTKPGAATPEPESHVHRRWRPTSLSQCMLHTDYRRVSHAPPRAQGQSENDFPTEVPPILHSPNNWSKLAGRACRGRWQSDTSMAATPPSLLLDVPLYSITAGRHRAERQQLACMPITGASHVNHRCKQDNLPECPRVTRYGCCHVPDSTSPVKGVRLAAGQSCCMRAGHRGACHADVGAVSEPATGARSDTLSDSGQRLLLLPQLLHAHLLLVTVPVYHQPSRATPPRISQVLLVAAALTAWQTPSGSAPQPP